MYYLNYNFPIFKIREPKGNKYSGRVQLDEIMKKLFYIQDKRPIIDLLNSLYGNNIGYDAQITYLNKEAITESIKNYAYFTKEACDMIIRVDYDDKSYEYIMEFQTKNDESIAIRLFRYSFDLKLQSLKNISSQETTIIDFPNPYVIVLEENKKVPDEYKFILRFSNGKSFSYSAKVLKLWRYDLEKLYQDNMYLLLPLKVFSIRKEIDKLRRLKEDNENYDILIARIKDDILNLTREILEYLDFLYNERKINVSVYNDFTVAMTNLTKYLLGQIDKLNHLSEEVREMVETFYNPKIKEEGKIEGKIEGKQEGKIESKREDILELLEDIGTVSEEVKKLIVNEADIERLKKWLKLAARANSVSEFMDKAKMN